MRKSAPISDHKAAGIGTTPAGRHGNLRKSAPISDHQAAGVGTTPAGCHGNCVSLLP